MTVWVATRPAMRICHRSSCTSACVLILDPTTPATDTPNSILAARYAGHFEASFFPAETFLEDIMELKACEPGHGEIGDK